MKEALVCAWRALSCPVAVGSGILGVSLVSLAAAYIAQYGFGLAPCILCLLQRIPFALGVVLGTGCMLFGRYGKIGAASVCAALSGLVFLVGSSLAAYHSGVERHWWKSVFESCSGPQVGAGSALDLLRSIEQATTAVPCDRIPWADPVLGLSMANYNAVMSLGLAALCLLAAVLIRRNAAGGGCARPG